MTSAARTATSVRAGSFLLAALVAAALLVAVAFAAGGCGNAGTATSTAGPATSLLTTTSILGRSSGAPPNVTDTTVAVSTGTSGGGVPQTTAVTGTTLPEGTSATRTLTFVGADTISTWQALRQIVIDAGGDGQKVLDKVAGLSVGPAVRVGQDELDAVSGIGFSAGADTSQPIAVAVGDDGREVLVFSYTVISNIQMTTVVGFERYTDAVVRVEGPLPISGSTGNITTIPAP